MVKLAKPRLATVNTVTARIPPKRADLDLQTLAHMAWRLEVILRAGHVCQGCGRQGRTRGFPDGCMLFADHIVERRDGGSLLDPANGQALCGSCHSTKTAAARAARAARDGAPS